MESLDAILTRHDYAKERIRERTYLHTQKEKHAYVRRTVERSQQGKVINIGAGALVFHPSGDKRMLFVKEKRLVQGMETEQWAAPGGGVVEEDNLVENALRREIREETGIEIEVGQLHLVDRIMGRDQAGEVLYDFYFLTFDAQALNENISPQDPKTIKAAWMKTLPKDLLLREDYELVMEQVKKRKLEF